jgi:hypothetical protein
MLIRGKNEEEGFEFEGLAELCALFVVDDSDSCVCSL